jgi:Fur family ferric uptake transcriptional regulator
MKEVLQNKNLSVTPLRLNVLGIINSSLSALSAQEIGEKLNEYNRITLYRTLKSFISSGIIHEIALAGLDPMYALCIDECSSETHNHQHIHFSCTECDKVLCVEAERMPTIQIPNFSIESLDIQAKGICNNCSE